MSRAGSTYPPREPYFAHRYCRLLTKTCAAQEIGHVGFALCVTIANLEDSKRYTGAVTFYNEQLMPLVAVTKWESLDRARHRAAAAGWLHYEPGNRGQRMPGRYWVTIPTGLDVLDDAPCDESHYPPNGESVKANILQRGNETRAITPDDIRQKGIVRGNVGGNIPTLPLTLKKRAPAGAGGDVPAGLLELIDGWNELGPAIVRAGNGARRDPPAKAALSGWNRATKNPEQREAIKDIPALLTAIRGAAFCHGQGWFDLPWLFGRNKNSEFNTCRLLAGAYDGNGNGQTKKSPEPEKYRG